LILYINGDSHSAGAEAVNSFAFAYEDKKYRDLGKSPHPDNLKASYGQLIADNLGYQLICDAESGASNTRILRTTYSYLENNTPDLIIIGWATWERSEWVFGDNYYQFSAGMNFAGLPKEIGEIYKQWVIDRDRPDIYCKYWQQRIWQLHQDLIAKQIPHLFFNTYSNLLTFKEGAVPCGSEVDALDWGFNYIDPYNQNSTYFSWLASQGLKTVDLTSFHYGASAHEIWADHLTKIIKESIMVK
jgi:hypothetical protein